MSGPWDAYAAPSAQGPPWANYSAPPTAFQSVQASVPGAILQGARDPIDELAKLLPLGLSEAASAGGYFPNSVSAFLKNQANQVSALNDKNNAAYQQSRAATGETGTDVGRITGNILSPVNFAGMRAASAIPQAASLAGRLAQGATLGAALGLTSPSEGTDNLLPQKLEQAGIGAGAGVLAPVVGGAVSRVVSPKLSPEVQTLLNDNIPLTPGQTQGGLLKRLEDASTSAPLSGYVVQAAKNNSIVGLNRAVYNRALAPIGASVPDNVPIGREGVEHVANKLSDAYNALLPKLNGTIADPQFQTDLSDALDAAKDQLPAAQFSRFEQILQNQIIGKIDPNGNFDGDTLKGIESEIGRQVKGYMGDPLSHDNRELGNHLADFQDDFRDMLSRQNPQYAPELQAINKGYANYAILRRAASSTGTATNDGVFTPGQLSAAVRASDRSVGKGNYAKGNALMQDLSDAASSVLPSKVPDSGTPLRMFTNLGLTGVGYGLGGPAPLAAQAAHALAYTQPAQTVLRGVLTARPQSAVPLANLIRQNSTLAIPPLSTLLQIAGPENNN